VIRQVCFPLNTGTMKAAAIVHQAAKSGEQKSEK
jgi:hypothetical protein